MIQPDLIKFGPFVLSNELSVGTIVSLILLTLGLIKFIIHLNTVNVKVDQMWLALIGTGPADDKSFFSRFVRVEEKVNQMWERLRFEKINEIKR